MSRVIQGPSIDFTLVETADGPMVRITRHATGELIDHIDLELFTYMVGRAEANVLRQTMGRRTEDRDDRWTNEPS